MNYKLDQQVAFPRSGKIWYGTVVDVDDAHVYLQHIESPDGDDWAPKFKSPLRVDKWEVMEIVR